MAWFPQGGETEVDEIKTQGLQSGNRSAWVTKFFLDFRRSDGSLWEDYKENNSVRVSCKLYENNFIRLDINKGSSLNKLDNKSVS